MFHQSYNPFARLDLPFRLPKEASQRVRRNRKNLAQRLEEQDRKLQQLSFEELPFGLLHQSKDEEDVAINNNYLNSCPPTICAPQDDCDLLELDYPDSPMTHPPRTVIVRTGGLKPRKKNSVHRKRLFSIDFSTICTERGEETSLGEEDLCLYEGVQRSAASFHHHDDQDDEDDDGVNECDEVATFSTYPPTSIMLVHNHLDVIATSHRSWIYRSCSDLSGSCSSHGQNDPSLTLPKLEEPQLWVQNEYESSYKLDVDEETDEEDQIIPHVMSCPDSMLEDSEDEDDVFDSPCTET